MKSIELTLTSTTPTTYYTELEVKLPHSTFLRFSRKKPIHIL